MTPVAVPGSSERARSRGRTRRRPSVPLLGVVLAALGLGACSDLPFGSSSCDPSPRDVVCVSGVRLSVEVADDREERETGLSGRTSLPEDHGMLFVFETAARHGFWMKDTTIPLSIAFADSAGVIRQIEALEPLSEEVVSPAVPVLLALEVNRGWFGEHGVGLGDTIRE